MTLTAADDDFHPVADPDPLWTETTWWGFTVPERSLGGMVYALFRPNLGVASLVIQVWDAEAVEPWRAPYFRSMWHLAHPTSPLTDCSLSGLTIRREQPLQEYELGYADGPFSFELTYRGLADPYEVPVGGGSGHFDQVCQVTGTLRWGDDTVAVDGPAVRDRSWYVRQDQRSLRAGYTYAVADGTHLVVHGRPDAVVGGYLERDGRRAPLVAGSRMVVDRRRGHPDHLTITATDADGREVVATGRTFASLASQSTPGMFAWMSAVEWEVDGRRGVGEDHDVWSPDQLMAARSVQ